MMKGEPMDDATRHSENPENTENLESTETKIEELGEGDLEDVSGGDNGVCGFGCPAK
jgi:hypothetical protein